MQAIRTMALAAALGLGLASAASAQDLLFSPDITADLGAGPSAVLDDDDAGVDDGAGGVTALLPPLPSGVDVIALHDIGGGILWLSLDTTAPLPGLGAPAEPRDVVAWDQNVGTFSLLFDGSAAGVPANARVDALTIDPGGDLAMSFDITVVLPGPLTAADEDLVTFLGGAFGMFFDGSAAGVPTSTDLDGAHMDLPGTVLLLSFDTSGSVAGLSYDDEDVVAYDTGAGTFALYQDSSATTDPVDWPPADLVAVSLPEPGSLPAALACLTALAGLARVRRARG